MSDRSVTSYIWRFFSGFGLATALIVLLGVQTWMATLEMTTEGLLPTLDKYFHWTSWFVLAKIPVVYSDAFIRVPLPGGYWICALLLVNMTLGGLIRARKGMKTAGVLIAHFGIIFMVAAGGVAQFLEERGVMLLFEGDTSDYAISLTEPTLEVITLEDGKPVDPVTVVEPSAFRNLRKTSTRNFLLPDHPFDIEITGWLENSLVLRGEEDADKNPLIDGYRLVEWPTEKEKELNMPGCYARVIMENGSKGDPFILAMPPAGFVKQEYPPHIVEADGKRYAVRLVKKTVPAGVKVKLDKAIAEYYPGTSKPKKFESEIEVFDEEGASGVEVDIKMNEPMRRNGYTFYQRTMSGGPQEPGARYSGLEVVSNPAEKWPEYSLWVVTFGLLLHFVYKLSVFLVKGSSRKKPATS